MVKKRDGLMKKFSLLLVIILAATGFVLPVNRQEGLTPNDSDNLEPNI